MELLATMVSPQLECHSVDLNGDVLPVPGVSRFVRDPLQQYGY